MISETVKVSKSSFEPILCDDNDIGGRRSSLDNGKITGSEFVAVPDQNLVPEKKSRLLFLFYSWSLFY